VPAFHATTAPPRRAPALLALALVAAGGDRAALDIRADRLELDQPGGVARFEGNVVATQDEVELRCARLVARYDAKGEVGEVVAEGDVRVKSRDLAATAARASFDRAAGVLTLTGAPAVTRGPDHVRGETIRLWPDSGRVVVEQARGRLLVPRIARDTAPPGGAR
jgi:lipopolysaccharide transport protein LptA